MYEQQTIAIGYQKKITLVTPVIYNCVQFHRYGVCTQTGRIYSNKRSGWSVRKTHVSGKSPYPSANFSVNGVAHFFQHHVAVHETLNPNFPPPPGISDEDWAMTPDSVKKATRGLWQVNHIDHDPENWHPSNLEWLTGKQNVAAYQKHRVSTSNRKNRAQVTDDHFNSLFDLDT
jgi:hypothetical protein